MVKVECAKCGGKGEIKAFFEVAGGVCFTCNGKGFKECKSAPRHQEMFQISAITKDSGERLSIFSVRARDEKAATLRAMQQLARGTGYVPESVLAARC